MSLAQMGQENVMMKKQVMVTDAYKNEGLRGDPVLLVGIFPPLLPKKCRNVHILHPCAILFLKTTLGSVDNGSLSARPHELYLFVLVLECCLPDLLAMWTKVLLI